MDGTEDVDFQFPEGVRLMWEGQRHPARGPRPALSLDRIVAEATALADADGLDALSMQRLAQRLGCGTMSLYRYVPGKDELVALMFDTAVGEPSTVDIPSLGWRGALEVWARDNLAVFRRHPWALAVGTRPRMMGPREVAFTEAALRALAHTGLDGEQQLRVLLLVNAYVRGMARLAIDSPGDEEVAPFTPQLFERFGYAERFPLLNAIMAGGALTDGPGDPHGEATFELGLGLLLDGLVAHVAEAAR